ncbi:hypothetical protein L345_11563, partial [Ophiophagus hannah]
KGARRLPPASPFLPLPLLTAPLSCLQLLGHCLEVTIAVHNSGSLKPEALLSLDKFFDNLSKVLVSNGPLPLQYLSYFLNNLVNLSCLHVFCSVGFTCGTPIWVNVSFWHLDPIALCTPTGRPS